MKKEANKNIKDINDIKEIKEIKIKVDSDKKRPSIHLVSPSGLINDPNALYHLKGTHYINYQWFPFFGYHGLKHWGNVKTKDFINFESDKNIIYPSKEFDNGGIYSGGAIVENDKVHKYYTGNIKDNNLDSVDATTVYLNDKNKKLLFYRDKNKYTKNFRDPKPCIVNGTKTLLHGGQSKDNKGKFVIYQSNDWDKDFVWKGDISFSKKQNTGYMVECPDYFQVNGNDILIASFEGVLSKWLPREVKYIIGNLDNDFVFNSNQKFKTLDYGFDFYAPQIYNDGNRNIMIGWVGTPGWIEKTDQLNSWSGMLTFPREVKLIKGKLYNYPIDELDNLIDKKIDDNNIYLFKSSYLLKGNNEDVITFGNNEVVIKIKNKNILVDRTNEINEKNRIIDNNKFSKKRKIKINNLKNWLLLIDKSVIELFINDGEYSFTTRINVNDSNITFKNAKAFTLKPIKIKGGYYE